MSGVFGVSERENKEGGLEYKGRDSRRRRPEYSGRHKPLHVASLLAGCCPRIRSSSSSSPSSPLPASRWPRLQSLLRQPRIHFPLLFGLEFAPRTSSSANSLPATRRPRILFPLPVVRDLASRFPSARKSSVRQHSAQRMWGEERI